MRGRRLLVPILVLLALALGVDLARPVESQVMTRLALVGIDVYQATASKALERAGARCRFTPTCSRYGEAVIRRYGILEGGAMAVGRIFRCGPWTPMGTIDPPPGGEIGEAPAALSPALPQAESDSGEARDAGAPSDQ